MTYMPEFVAAFYHSDTTVHVVPAFPTLADVTFLFLQGFQCVLLPFRGPIHKRLFNIPPFPHPQLPYYPIEREV